MLPKQSITDLFFRLDEDNIMKDIRYTERDKFRVDKSILDVLRTRWENKYVPPLLDQIYKDTDVIK